MAENTGKKSESREKGDEIVALSPKRERFCQEFIKDHNATQAAIRSGYSVKTAREQGGRLLTIVAVKTRIEQLEKPIAERLQLDAEYVLRGAKTAFERCMQVAPVVAFDPVDKELKEVVDPEGNKVFQFDPKGGAPYLQLIAKHVGGFNDKTIVTFDDASNFAKMLGQIILKYVPEEKIDACSQEISSIIAKANE